MRRISSVYKGLLKIISMPVYSYFFLNEGSLAATVDKSTVFCRYPSSCFSAKSLSSPIIFLITLGGYSTSNRSTAKPFFFSVSLHCLMIFSSSSRGELMKCTLSIKLSFVHRVNLMASLSRTLLDRTKTSLNSTLLVSFTVQRVLDCRVFVVSPVETWQRTVKMKAVEPLCWLNYMDTSPPRLIDSCLATCRPI